jgi:azurin
MKRAFLSLLLLGLAVFPAQPLAQGANAAAGRLIEIEGNDQMKFSVTNITAKPGEPLRVRLKVVGAMPKMAMAHNFVLLKAGIDAAKFANESALAGPAANYIAAARKADVLTSTPLAGAGETVEITFKAPAQAGSYTFLCSFPGHFAAGMRGTLVVK